MYLASVLKCAKPFDDGLFRHRKHIFFDLPFGALNQPEVATLKSDEDFAAQCRAPR
jgi:hypothetical protein